MKIGLFFGSFNPIHIGHLLIANKTLEIKSLDELWFVVSPQNPHKSLSELSDVNDRIKMIEIAISKINNSDKFKVCDIELYMTKPNYTIDTLNVLKTKYPENEFSLIMGYDNVLSIETWKDYEELLCFNKIIAYKRVGFEDLKNKVNEYKNIEVIGIPSMEMSATYIRNQIKTNKSIEFMVPERVVEYIKENNLYI